VGNPGCIGLLAGMPPAGMVGAAGGGGIGGSLTPPKPGETSAGPAGTTPEAGFGAGAGAGSVGPTTVGGTGGPVDLGRVTLRGRGRHRRRPKRVVGVGGRRQNDL